MRKVNNGATVICEAPLPNSPGWNVVLCDWGGKSVSWMEKDGVTVEGYYESSALYGFLKRAQLDSFRGWYKGSAL